MRERMVQLLRKLGASANRGWRPYAVSIALLALGFTAVYSFPRSIPGFLLFAFSASSAIG